jgi:hypothetical protein
MISLSRMTIFLRPASFAVAAARHMPRRVWPGLQSGGKVHERPCRDGFDRAFHCGSGLPWTDAQVFLQNKQIHPNGKITLHWRF